MRQALVEDASLSRILKNTGWLTGSSGVSTALSMVQGVLTARLLGVSTWGALAVALGFGSVVGLLLSFRMDSFVVKWVTQFKEQDPRLAPTAFKVALMGDIATAMLSFVAVEGLAVWGAEVFAKSPHLVWVFRVIALNVLLQAGRESFTGILHVCREFRIQAVIQVVCQAASTAGVVVVFLIGGGLPGVISVLVLVQVLGATLYCVYGLRAARTVLGSGWLRAPLERPGALGRDMAHFAVMVNIGATLRATMNDGDLLILGFLTSPAQVAYYKLAKSICQIAQLPMMPMVDASYPEFSSSAAKGDWGVFRSLMRRGTKVAAAWVIPVSAALVALAPIAVSALYGPSFLPAVPALALLLVGYCFDGILFWTNIALYSVESPRYATGVSVGATITKLALAFLLVPMWGYVMLAGLQSLTLTGSNLLVARRVYSRVRAKESQAAA